MGGCWVPPDWHFLLRLSHSQLSDDMTEVTPHAPLLSAQAWGLPAMISTLLSFPGRLANWALLAAQRLMTGSIPAKLASYFAIGMPLVLGCAVLYRWAGGARGWQAANASNGDSSRVEGCSMLVQAGGG